MLAVFAGCGLLRGDADVGAISDFQRDRRRTEADDAAALDADRLHDTGFGDGAAVKLGRIERQTLLLSNSVPMRLQDRLSLGSDFNVARNSGRRC